MNKKRLSVVMAGAMLASSVAPVLAAEEVAKVEISASNIGLLVDEISRKIQEGPVFSNAPGRDDHDNTLAGKSVYGIQIGSAKPEEIEKKDTLSLTQKEVKDKLTNVKVGEVVKLVDLGYAEVVEGNDTIIVSKEKRSTYSEEELKGKGNGSVYRELVTLETGANATNFKKAVADYEYVEGEGFVITFQDAITFYGPEKKLVLTTKTSKLNFARYYNVANKSTDVDFGTDPTTAFYGFKAATIAETDIAPSVIKEFTITSGGNIFDLSDLYDGLMLKEKGQVLLNEAKDALAIAGEAKKADIVGMVDANAHATSNFIDNTGDALSSPYTLTADAYGVYRVRVDIADASKVTATGWSKKIADYKTYYITSKDKVALARVLGWLDNVSADVDVLAGEDRYETAVRIAKEVTLYKSADKVTNIVLVNGDSLVDGLAAAPLAEHLGKGKTPILLTENNSLPRATKLYLQELVDESKNTSVTVSIVGGDGVVSNSVVRELKDMNLKVKRYGGADREATSMAVLDKVGINASKGAFVVGATGEADAMSIAGYAAQEGMPIIVSGFEGLSEDTIQELDGNIVKVIGGTGAVSEDTYKSIKEVTNRVERISGEDRKATNAAVIDKFYTTLGNTTESVIVAKDDVLIDALTAANLSAKQHSPIVLATNSLTDDQLNAVVKNANSAQKVKKVYQVGYGVDPLKVVKVIAETLGLA